MDTYFGDLLKEARERSGLTQKELAKLIQIDHTYLSKIERGMLPPPARGKVLKIADVFGITNPVERYHLLLAAGCADIDDLDGLNAMVGKQTSPLIPPRHAALVLAHPPLPTIKDTIGARIEYLLAMAELSDEEKAAVEKHLEAVAKETVALLEATRQLKPASKDKS